jgi:hypothetical protein
MYQPVPLNWMAGADSRRCTGPPQVRHVVTDESENRWMTSNLAPHVSHSYS